MISNKTWRPTLPVEFDKIEVVKNLRVLGVIYDGRLNFIDHINKKTTWVDPRNSRPSPLPSQSNVPNRRHHDDLGPLPEGWEEESWAGPSEPCEVPPGTWMPPEADQVEAPCPQGQRASRAPWR